MSDVGQKIEQAKIIMNENVAGNVDPEELAMRLNISYSWFRRVFKENTGYAPAKYFQELKLRKAKQVDNSGIFFETNLSSNNIISFIKDLLSNMNLDIDDFSFSLSKAPFDIDDENTLSE